MLQNWWEKVFGKSKTSRKNLMLYAKNLINTINFLFYFITRSFGLFLINPSWFYLVKHSFRNGFLYPFILESSRLAVIILETDWMQSLRRRRDHAYLNTRVSNPRDGLGSDWAGETVPQHNKFRLTIVRKHYYHDKTTICHDYYVQHFFFNCVVMTMKLTNRVFRKTYVNLC